MACLSLHLAIAKKYLEQHKNLNYEDVMKGTLYPDVVKEDDKTHYKEKNRGTIS